MTDSDASSVVSWDRLSPEETRTGLRTAARQMGDLVRTTLGPAGADKMIVRRMQDDTLRTFVSNDGVAILEEFEGETDHPVANRFISLAEQQESSYGDGTTTTALWASELLSTGVDLVEEGVAPIDVVEGFSIGAQRTLEVWDESSILVASSSAPTTRSEFDLDRLERIARCGMTNGRDGSWPLAAVADDVVDAVLRAWEPQRGTVDLNYVSIEAIPGGEAAATEVIPGALRSYEPMKGEHLLPVEGGVLLVDGGLAPRDVESGSLTVDGGVDGGVRGLESENDAIARAVADSGAKAVFATGNVTNEIARRLADLGVVPFRNVKATSVDILSRVTGATIRGPATPGEPATAEDLGYGRVELRRAQGDKTWLTVTAPDGSAHDPRTIGLVVRGGSESAADEARRRIKDGLNAVRAAVKRPEALPGGGAADLRAARSVRELAPRFDGREQLAVEAFADVLESIPETLARNAAHDPIDALAELRARHDAGAVRAGIDADGRIVDDVVESGDALDALLVRTSGLAKSVEFANSLLTVDGVVFDREPPIDPSEIGP